MSVLDNLPRLHQDTLTPTGAWKDPDEIKGQQAYRYNTDKGQQIMMGRLDGQLIGIKDDRHIFTCAGSRAGKSVGLINNLFFYRGSCVVVDPKTEIANKTAKRRSRGLGQDVKVLDPFNRADPEIKDLIASYNPLADLGIDNEYTIEDVAEIADALVVRSANEKDPHWNESAMAFIEGVILHVCTHKIYSQDDKTLPYVRHLIANGDEEPRSKLRGINWGGA